MDQPEAYTAFKLVVSIPGQAAKEAKENLKVPEFQDRPVKAYPQLLSGVANKNSPERGKLGTLPIKLKNNPKVDRHWEFQLQGDGADSMKKRLIQFIDRSCIEPSNSERASAAFIVPEKSKGEWRLLVDYMRLKH